MHGRRMRKPMAELLFPAESLAQHVVSRSVGAQCRGSHASGLLEPQHGELARCKGQKAIACSLFNRTPRWVMAGFRRPRRSHR